MTIAERIICIVEKNGGNMSDFARRLNVTPAYISKFKKYPDTEPSDRFIKSICAEYYINEEWLRYGTGEMHIDTYEVRQIADFINNTLESPDDSFKRRLISALSQLDEKSWQVLSDLAERIEKK